MSAGAGAAPLPLEEPPRTHVLHPGDVVCGVRGDRLETLLGSCVAVILTDPRRTVGTMCHIVHVGRPNHANLGNTAYGEVAMQAMFDRLGLTPRPSSVVVEDESHAEPALG